MLNDILRNFCRSCYVNVTVCTFTCSSHLILLLLLLYVTTGILFCWCPEQLFVTLFYGSSSDWKCVFVYVCIGDETAKNFRYRGFMNKREAAKPTDLPIDIRDPLRMLSLKAWQWKMCAPAKLSMWTRSACESWLSFPKIDLQLTMDREVYNQTNVETRDLLAFVLRTNFEPAMETTAGHDG